MVHALIIDDQTPNITVLGMLLEQQNITHAWVTNPDHIYEVAEQEAPIDIVFLDLEFPNGDGLELLADLKQHPDLMHAPIIAYSVHTSELDTARQVGFDGFLGKPLDAFDFPGHLERILNGEAVWVV